MVQLALQAVLNRCPRVVPVIAKLVDNCRNMARGDVTEYVHVLGYVGWNSCLVGWHVIGGLHLDSIE